MSDSKKEFQDSIKNWMTASLHASMRKMHIFAKENNISFTQMNCLFKMKKHGPYQVNQVSTFFDISKPAASQLLDKLVTMGLVKRTESDKDRRVKFHNLTKKGEDFVNEFFSSIQDLHSELVESFEKKDYRKNSELLDCLTKNLLDLSGFDNKENKCSN